MIPKWTVPNNFNLASIEENVTTTISLPIESELPFTTSVISGQLPLGLRIENNTITGTPFEVSRPTTSKFVIRASNSKGISDRTFYILVEGSDPPEWITPSGKLPVGPNNTLFILDNTLIDYQLIATDPDLPAGDELKYYVSRGELPDGITLSEDGRLQGIVDPLLSLEINVIGGGYDTNRFSIFPYDFAFDVEENSRIPKKLNRNFEFEVTVTDNVSAVSRIFQIFVVGDDFARADNTIMKAANGVFTADFTFLRVPLWLTSSDLGTRRANNFLTIYLDAFDSNTIIGTLKYFLEPLNEDGSISEIPPGLFLDADTGELAGRVPSQPAATRNYKFTINAVRFDSNEAIVTVFATFFEDTLAGKSTLKIGKLSRTPTGLDELRSLINRTVVINNNNYKILSVDSSNELFDTITIDSPLSKNLRFSPLVLNRTAESGDREFFVNSLLQTDRQFYLKKEIIFNDQEKYQIDDIFPYIEWKINSNTDIRLKDSNSSSIENALTEMLTVFDRPADIKTVETNGIVTEVTILAASTSQTRNRNFINDLFENTDLSIELQNEVDRIKLDKDLERILSTGTDLNFGVVRGDNFNRTFSVIDEQEVSKKKEFNIKLLGEVDSIIAWLTPKDLGELNANRISTLSVKATSTVPAAQINYNLTKGELPPGLKLSTLGEIIGKVPVTGTEDEPGLIRFYEGDDETGERLSTTTFDGNTTTFDREYRFTVLASDKFKFSAIEREFFIKIVDRDNLNYSNIYIQPYVQENVRANFRNLLDNGRVIDITTVYRPNDNNFGIQSQLRALVYAGIENRSLSEFVQAVSQNHKRMKFYFGDVKTAIARRPGTNEIVYEVVYIELSDSSNIQNKKTKNSIQIQNSNKITVDNTKYDSITNYRPNNLEPHIARPNTTNTVTTDSSAIKADQKFDSFKYISNVRNMRNRIKNIVVESDDSTVRNAVTSRDFLPLWMRTPQNDSLVEPGFILAVPIVYTKPGFSQTVKENILNENFNFNQINYDIDRYIIDSVENNNNEQFILFANYKFNV